jgi:hypothetical protein
MNGNEKNVLTRKEQIPCQMFPKNKKMDECPEVLPAGRPLLTLEEKFGQKPDNC